MLLEIKWEDLQVGDVFVEDMSRVVHIDDWDEQLCYKLVHNDGSELIASENHLIAINDESNITGELTEIGKTKVLDKSINWVAVKDLYNSGKRLFTRNNESFYIEPYDDLKPQKVRCITTDKGTYTINGFLNHNTARGSHSLDSMKDIVYNLINVAGMSEEWVSQNLYLDLESIKRMQQLSGLKAAFSDTIDDCDMAWSPEKDKSYQRKMVAYLIREATNYIENYKKEHSDIELSFNGTAIDIALTIGFHETAVYKNNAEIYEEYIRENSI